MLRTSVDPIPTVRSRRPDIWRGLTSCNPGVFNPIAFIPLLREDRLRGRVTVQVMSEETVKVIVNPVRVRAEAYLVPKTVLERFQGSMEALNRAYMGEPAPSGFGTTPKWFIDGGALPAGDSGHEIYDILGLHWQDGDKFNTDLLESYNQVWNWNAKARSQGITLAALNNSTILPAFWDAWRFDWVKPSFDAAQMEGTIPIRVDGDAIPKVIGYNPHVAGSTPGLATGAALTVKAETEAGYQNKPLSVTDADGTVAYLGLEAPGAGASISLANIALAQKTRAFAMMRDRYKTVPDEYLIDLLMRGIEIPEADLRQPWLIASAEGIIGQTERWATDGASLDTSVANGSVQISFPINTPQVNTGGMVLICVSIVPEQLFERVADPAMLYATGDKSDVYTPDYLADYLDPQKVETVPNYYVDVRHSDPAGIFGYAPLNYSWRRNYARVGGKYKRPVPDAFVEDRQRIWSIEKDSPELSSDWYLCPSPFPKSVFADTNADPYEVICVVQGEIVGNTVFGPRFDEDYGSWDAVIAQVDDTRLDGTPVAELAEMVAEESEE